MGVVHRAYDTVHHRMIALKRLSSTVVDDGFRARFQRESRIAAGLRHPHVVPVNAFGKIDGQLYLDMMLVDGTDLRRRIGCTALEPQHAIGLLSQVAEALDAAHAEGLIHRDVKPSNILISPNGHAYLADFGIAREISPQATTLTESGAIIGTWDYMAPERVSGGPVDGRADQYSLACVLFECLTGRLPHPAADAVGSVAGHLLQPPPAPSLFMPTITPALDEVVLRGLAKDPARRFPTSTELLAAAEAAMFTGSTIKAAAATASGPVRARDQGRLVRAVVRSTFMRRPTVPPSGDRAAPCCPYPGLRSFEADDAAWFHGRDQVVADLLVRLAEQLGTGEPVVLVGASGSGKSSVLRAGLLPALTDDPAEHDAWPQIICTPGADPVGALATALGPLTPTPTRRSSRALSGSRPPASGRCARRRTGSGRSSSSTSSRNCSPQTCPTPTAWPSRRRWRAHSRPWCCSPSAATWSSGASSCPRCSRHWPPPCCWAR